MSQDVQALVTAAAAGGMNADELLAKAQAVGIDRETIVKILQAMATYGPMFLQFLLSILQPAPGPLPMQGKKLKADCCPEHACHCHDAMMYALKSACCAAQCCCDCCD